MAGNFLACEFVQVRSEEVAGPGPAVTSADFSVRYARSAIGTGRLRQWLHLVAIDASYFRPLSY